MTRFRPNSRRGFTLPEAIVAVIVVSLLVPPAVSMLRDASTARAESLNIVRAALLAQGVLEQVEADASSSSLGMTAFGDANAYLNTASTGLVARMDAVSSFYTAMGMTWSLNIGGLVSQNGSATGIAAQDIYRYVQVTVSWSSDRSGTKSYTVGALVTDLTP